MSIIEKAINKQSATDDSNESTSVERAMSGGLSKPLHYVPEHLIVDEDVQEQNEVADNELTPEVSVSSVKDEKSSVTLDLQHLEQRNFVSLSSERRLINEEYRVIKRKLITNALAR